MKTGHTPSRSNPEYWEDVSIPWFTLADVWQLRDGRQVFLGDTASRISELGLANSAAELLPAGTVVLSRTASVGFSGVMPIAMATSQDFWNWVCGPDLLPEYLNYQFKAIAPNLRAMNMGSTHQTIYQRDAAGIEVLVPSLDEQRAIVDYLDRETARVDALIDEQLRLIEMLRERRKAVITVSTKGEQKDFIQLVRCVTEQVDYRGATPPKSDSGIQLVTARNVKRGWIDYGSSQEFVDPDTYAQVMRRGLPKRDDILFTMEAPLGNVALVDREDIALAQRIIKWTLDRDQVHPRYLLYAMLGEQFQHQLRIRSTGSTALGIKASKLPELRVWLPERGEQRRIAAFLDEETAKIDALIAETEKFIELSRERRSALISATVTGQIDLARVRS
ncbi:restriction endonuclease subunit S [Mycolicibacterium sp. P1-5]|nr:restriction endonuclease subunit S [Mycolicibacterium sp. P1-5]